MKKFAVLVAGGTGGHINAAIALGEKLQKKQFEVSYLTGQRPLDYKLFKGLEAKHLGSWPLRTKNPVKLVLSVMKNIVVFAGIFFQFLRKRPSFVVGAGGYVCGPTLLAAKLQAIPVFIVEQNAVMGLTNRLLARLSDLIFVHFQNTKGISEGLRSKVKVVGNPTRSSISYSKPRPVQGKLHVLVFGGSLGATQINQVIEALVQQDHASPISIIHQTGNDQQKELKLGMNVEYRPSKYLDQIQDQYAWCDMIVGRAGASTVSELRIIQKPCFLIPYPQATDNHQWYNATQFRDESVCPVYVAKPQDSQADLEKQLKDFMGFVHSGTLVSSQSPVATVDSSQRAIEEIFQRVGTV